MKRKAKAKPRPIWCVVFRVDGDVIDFARSSKQARSWKFQRCDIVKYIPAPKKGRSK